MGVNRTDRESTVALRDTEERTRFSIREMLNPAAACAGFLFGACLLSYGLMLWTYHDPDGEVKLLGCVLIPVGGTFIILGCTLFLDCIKRRNK